MNANGRARLGKGRRSKVQAENGKFVDALVTTNNHRIRNTVEVGSIHRMGNAVVEKKVNQ